VKEYLEDVEMDESGTSQAGNITPVPQSLPSLLHSEHGNTDNPLLGIRPLPRSAFKRRKDVEMDNNGTSHPESILPGPQQNAAASAGTVVLFCRKPDSPLFKVGDKRPAQEDEEHRKQKDERHKNQVRINVRAIQLRNNIVC
jgi:hypothetical protein